jgi:hypothetical protein
VDCDGETPLHVLIWRGDAEGALLLIENKRKQRRLVNMVYPCEKTHNNCIEFACCVVCRPLIQGIRLLKEKYESFGKTI